ncbi:MAG: GntR family transcriptional regulator [Oscillospiraceae bacterium]
MKSENTQNLSEQVYAYLLDMILSMEVKPGDKIPESKISKLFGISRTPIRDAMRQLANDGILNIYPNRFAEVAQWSEERIQQVGVTRVQMDNLAAKLAILNGSNADFNRMNAYSESCLRAADEGNVAQRIKDDCAFHLELSVISKNEQLLEFQRKLYLRIEFLQSWRNDFLENPQEQYRQHCEVIEALINRNEKQAIKIMTLHNIHFHNLEKQFPLEFFMNYQ